MSEETGAKIRILDRVTDSNDRIALVFGREDLEAEMSPAMDAMVRLFKRVNELAAGEHGVASEAATIRLCTVRLLVAWPQGVALIGKGGATIRSIHEQSGATVRVLSGEEMPLYVGDDERVVHIQGDPVHVSKALELVLGHLPRFVVDQSVIPLFDKILQTASRRIVAQNQVPDEQLPHSGLSQYGQDDVTSTLPSLAPGQSAGAVIPKEFIAGCKEPARSGYMGSDLGNESSLSSQSGNGSSFSQVRDTYARPSTEHGFGKSGTTFPGTPKDL